MEGRLDRASGRLKVKRIRTWATRKRLFIEALKRLLNRKGNLS